LCAEPSPEPARDRQKNLVSALSRPIVILFLLQLMGGMMLSPHRTFYPVYVRELGYSPMLISAVATVGSLMGLIGSLVGGSLSDSLGRKWTLFLGQIGFFLGSLVFLTRSPGWIAVLWAASGFGMGLHTLGGQSYLIDVAHTSYLGILSALYNWGYTLGGALGSPIAGWILDRWDFPTFGATLAAFAVATLTVNAWALPRSPAGKAADRSLAPGTSGAPQRRAFQGYADIARRPAVALLVLLRFLPTLYWGMAVVLIPLLLDATGANKTTIALYATVSQVCAALAQLITGRAIDRFGPKWPALITSSALVISIMGIGFLPGPMWSVFAFGTMSTAAAWSLSTLLPSLVAQVTVPQDRGRILGWVHLWWNLAMMIGSLVGGYLFQQRAGLPFIVTGAVNVLSVLLVVAFFRVAAQARQN
jgi:MFS family permease